MKNLIKISLVIVMEPKVNPTLSCMRSRSWHTSHVQTYIWGLTTNGQDISLEGTLFYHTEERQPCRNTLGLERAISRGDIQKLSGRSTTKCNGLTSTASNWDQRFLLLQRGSCACLFLLGWFVPWQLGRIHRWVVELICLGLSLL